MEYREFYIDKFGDDIYNIKIEYLSTHAAAIAKVIFEDFPSNKIYIGSGTAIREPNDKPDEEIAYFLALGRAFENLSGKLLKQANGLVKHNEDVAIAKEKLAKSSKVRNPWYINTTTSGNASYSWSNDAAAIKWYLNNMYGPKKRKKLK
jgi:hypothetical protein